MNQEEVQQLVDRIHRLPTEEANRLLFQLIGWYRSKVTKKEKVGKEFFESVEYLMKDFKS